MRRLGRFLLNALTSLSLLLCIAVVVLWIRSLSRLSIVTWSERVGPRAVAHKVRSLGGRLFYNRDVYEYDTDPNVINTHEVGDEPLHLEERAYGRRAVRSLSEDLPVLMFDRRLPVTRPPGLGPREQLETSVAYWLPALLTSLAPAGFAGLHVRRRWKRLRAAGAGGGAVCASCKYDLRATPDRCPECGAVPSNANAGKALP